MPRFTLNQLLLCTALVATGLWLLSLPPRDVLQMNSRDIGLWFYATLPIVVVAGALMGVGLTLPFKGKWRWVGAIAGAISSYAIFGAFRI